MASDAPRVLLRLSRVVAAAEAQVRVLGEIAHALPPADDVQRGLASLEPSVHGGALVAEQS